MLRLFMPALFLLPAVHPAQQLPAASFTVFGTLSDFVRLLSDGLLTVLQVNLQLLYHGPVPVQLPHVLPRVKPRWGRVAFALCPRKNLASFSLEWVLI